MKKTLILLALIPLMLGCTARTRDFSRFYPNDTSQVSRLIMLDGNTGEMREITDQTEIQAFFDMVETLSFMMQKDRSPRADFLYWVDIYEDGEPVLRLTFTEDTARVKGVYYLLDNNVRAELDQLYTSGVRVRSS